MSAATESLTGDAALSQRSSFDFWVSEQVRWSDTDLVGHVNNLSFAAYCETGRSLFFRPFVDRNSTQRAMMLPVQLIVNFKAEAYWPDIVEVGTGVLSIGNTSSRIGQGLFIGDRCVGTSITTVVFINEETRKPHAIPESIRSWLNERLVRTAP